MTPWVSFRHLLVLKNTLKKKLKKLLVCHKMWEIKQNFSPREKSTCFSSPLYFWWNVLRISLGSRQICRRCCNSRCPGIGRTVVRKFLNFIHTTYRFEKSKLWSSYSYAPTHLSSDLGQLVMLALAYLFFKRNFRELASVRFTKTVNMFHLRCSTSTHHWFCWSHVGHQSL